LILLGIVDSTVETGSRGGSKNLEVTRNEALGRIRGAEDADCYTILGVAKTVEGEEIRDSYYYLARRYHPDRFRTGPLQDIFDYMEQYFTKVTEAYNTLIDPDLRTVYDEELAKTGGVKKAEPEAHASHLARQNFLRAKALLAKKRFHDALTSLENAVQLDPSDASYQLELGQVLALNPRRRADAERHLLLATELNPASPHGYFALGELYLKLERVPDAERMYREVLRWEPKHAEARDRVEEIAGAGRRRGGLFKG
jgi:curved DNA-binding protein CbpA